MAVLKGKTFFYYVLSFYKNENYFFQSSRYLFTISKVSSPPPQYLLILFVLVMYENCHTERVMIQ